MQWYYTHACYSTLKTVGNSAEIVKTSRSSLKLLMRPLVIIGFELLFPLMIVIRDDYFICLILQDTRIFPFHVAYLVEHHRKRCSLRFLTDFVYLTVSFFIRKYITFRKFLSLCRQLRLICLLFVDEFSHESTSKYHADIKYSIISIYYVRIFF